MNTTERDVHIITNTHSLAAPQITHGLKQLGNGSMPDGLDKLATKGYQKGYFDGLLVGNHDGTIKGLVIGASIGLAVAVASMSVWRKYRIRKMRQTLLEQPYYVDGENDGMFEKCEENIEKTKFEKTEQEEF